MKVACIQPVARPVAEYSAAFGDMVRLTREAADGGAELIVQPETAYPAYFLGLDPEAMEKALDESAAYLDAMAGLAAERRVYIVACAAIRAEGRLYNAAVLYDDAGNECARTYKAALWHFDETWFHPGTEHSAFDTRFGRMGMMICADGRVPEIARLLALDGARVIIDPVNLVAAASRPDRLINPQTDYLLPVRAMENRVWILVANKTGVEAGAVTFSGRSMAIDPHGDIVASLPPDSAGILYCDIDPEEAEGPPPVMRRPELYGALARHPESSVEKEKLPATFAAVARFPADSGESYLRRSDHYCRAACLMGAGLLVLPPMEFPGSVGFMAEAIRPMLGEGMVATVSGDMAGIPGTVVFDGSGILGQTRRTHGGGHISDDPVSVFGTPAGRLAILLDEEAYVPEISRIAMVLGGEILVWYDSRPRTMSEAVLRARALENRVFIIRSCPTSESDAASIAGPEGTILTTTFIGAEQMVGANLFLPLARTKHIVPGTSVSTGRNLSSYDRLSRPK